MSPPAKPGVYLNKLVRQLTQLTIITTASRSETQAWSREMGAHHVIDHTKPFAEQLNALGIKQVEMTTSLTHTDQHWKNIVEVTSPQGQIALIDDPAHPLDIMILKPKSISLHWELMFTRSLFKTADMAEQGKILQRIAELVDSGKLVSTLNDVLIPINAANIRKAHQLIKSNRARGKIVLKGF